jgi:hypothetical protein
MKVNETKGRSGEKEVLKKMKISRKGKFWRKRKFLRKER